MNYTSIMIKTYLRIAWRNLWKNKFFSIINIGGLALGIASSVLLLNYVAYQFSYDDFHLNKNNIYRVGLDFSENNQQVFQSAENYSGVAPALKKDFPEIAEATRLYNMGYKNNCVFTFEEKHVKETKFFYADSSFLHIFSFPLLQGNPATALTEPYTAVISESFSRKVFGNQSAIGKSIQMDDDDRNAELCKITGVCKDIAENSHLKFNVLISYSTLYQRKNAGIRYTNAWDYKDFYTYILLRPGVDPNQLTNKFTSFVARHIPDEKAAFRKSTLFLQPLSGIHLNSSLIDEPETTGNEKAVYFLIVIAFFILTIAWVNYINLATAGSFGRAKEIGIRKVLGSKRLPLIRQFLSESLSINFISFVLGILLASLIKSQLTRFFPVPFAMSSFIHNGYGMIFIAFMFFGAFLSGLYPALVLSAFKPIAVLKGKVSASRNGIALRKSLVVFQFALSIFLIIGTLIVYKQVKFLLIQNTGLHLSQVITLDRPGRWDSARASHSLYVERFKNELKNNPDIEAVGMSDELPGKEIRRPGNYTNHNSQDESPIPINTITIDEDYLNTLGIPIETGRNFSSNIRSDARGLIVTASAARLLGFNKPASAIGKTVFSEGAPYSILGVVKDFHQQSLIKKAYPVAFQFSPDAREFEYYLVKIRTARSRQAIAHIQTAWNSSFSGNPFAFSFLDEFFNRQYQHEQQFGSLFAAFSLIAIVIACIGLFALVAIMVQQRTKELGLRKVLGAGQLSLILLLTRDFTRLVVLANIIAWPLGYLLMNNWLEDFAYHIQISLIVFLAGGLGALVIAIATISVQAIKAAGANPVNSLRTE